MSELVTDAEDWRSESEKRNSMFRKAAINLLKLWIPDHAEASMQKIELMRNWHDAMQGWAERVTFVSMLSSGIEDVMVHDYGPRPVSLQSLLVQREGTDAFLDARNALRVVRRKFGMMTLIARMAGVFEQRNIHALTLRADMTEPELLTFAKLMSSRVEGTSNEEEQRFRMAMRRSAQEKVDIFFHNDVIGRRLPVAWQVKALYSQLARRIKGGVPHTEAADVVITAAGPALGPRGWTNVAQYAPDLAEDLDAPGGFDPADRIIAQATEKPLLAITRRMYDDFNLLRRERDHERAMSGAEAAAGDGVDAEMDFLTEAEIGHQEDDQLVRLAGALDRIRRVRGRAFFSRMSMVGEQVDFFEVVETTSLEDIESRVEDMDPMEGLAHARAIREPFYRCRGLEAAARRLIAGGQMEEAGVAAREALESARECHGEDKPQAFAAALGALLASGCVDESAAALEEALGNAHAHNELTERSAALMRVASTLMQAGALEPEVRSRLSRALLGDDVHFWGKPEVTPALVEACLSLLSAMDDDTFIFLQKVIAHPEEAVRQSVIRAMPFGDDPTLRNMLLSHLRDPSPAVRLDVVERIGFSGDRTLFIYLINHLRHDHASGLEEHRALALCMARLDANRSVPLLNAMLGKLATPDKQLVGQQTPFKADEDMQLAALEALYYLNNRISRRILFTAREKAKKGLIAGVTEQIWSIVKSRQYGEPMLPRSPHHPEWTDADSIDFLARLERDAPEVEPEPEPEPGEEDEVATEEAPSGRRSGLFGRIKKLFGKGDEEEATDDAPADAEAPDDTEGALADSPDAPTEAEAPKPPPRAALRFEGVLLEGPEIWSGVLAMTFTLYGTEAGGEPLWREAQGSVPVESGAFEVTLGLDERLPALPNVVWMGLSLDGGAEMAPRTRLGRMRSVVFS